MEPIRILGIAPYEGMKQLMEAAVKDFPQIELTLFVGDLEHGLAIARQNFHGNYDVIISRGATARILRESLPLPVVDIEISMYDILFALKLSNALTEKAALVSYADIGDNARKLCELMGYDIDIYLLSSPAEAEPVLRRVQERRYDIIICDASTNTVAQHLGFSSVLITSGPESIRQSLQRAVTLCADQVRLRNESRFFRELINHQVSDTILLEEDGSVYLSTVQNIPPELLDTLRLELPESVSGEERRITKAIGGMIYNIRIRPFFQDGRRLVGFFFTSRKSPLPLAQSGIRYFTRPEAEQAYLSSVSSFAGVVWDYRDEIGQIIASRAPVLIAGEDGTGKDAIAYTLFIQGPWKGNTLVCVDISQLTDRSWEYLLEHHSSPLAGSDYVMFFYNIDILSEERKRRFIATIKEMDVCRRNRVFFSCVCHPNESMSPTGALFANELNCLTFSIRPLRRCAREIPTLVNIILSHLNADSPNQIRGMEEEAMELLRQYPWPHNYTQFRRVMSELAASCTGPAITADMVRDVLNRERHMSSFTHAVENYAVPLDLNRSLYEISRDIVRRVVEESDGNQTAAAKRLGISRTTLWRYLKEE